MHTISETIINQIDASFYDMFDEHYYSIYTRAVINDINNKRHILGPLCSNCKAAEPTVEIIYSDIEGHPWYYLVNVSVRCLKTSREYLTHQIYLDGEKAIPIPEQRDRHPGRITKKIGCLSLDPITE